MSDLKVCRICLAKNIKMYSYNEYNLKQYYEELMNEKMSEELPVYFCYMCGAVLNKFHMFKEKCHNGQEVLKKLLVKGLLTLSSISQVNRKSKRLESTIGIITLNKRVKTFTFKHKKVIEVTEYEKKETNEENEIETEDVLDMENIKLDYDSHDSFDCDEVKIDIDVDKADIKAIEIDKPNIAIIESNVQLKPNSFEGIPNKVTAEVLNISKQKSNHVRKGKKRKFTATSKRRRKTSEKSDTSTEKDLFKNDKHNETPNIIKEGQKKKRGPPNSRRLDPKHWLKVTLSDEEAMDNFKARAFEAKYISAAYKCEKCLKVFSKEDILSRHMKLSHCQSIGSYECRFCSVMFKRKSRLTKHMTTHYCKFKCLRCGLVLPLEDTAYCHNDVHSGVMRKCEQCGLQFRHYSTYYTHLRVYHRSEHVCTLCGASFVTEKGLRQHKNIKHVNVDHKSVEESESTYCKTCDIKFNSQQAYKEHLGQSIKHADIPPKEQDGNLTIDEPPPALLKESLHRPMQRRSQETTCFVCEKVFPNYYRYKTHHRAEHKHIPIPTGSTQMCEICGATIKSGSIAIHMNIHTREKLYPCQTCGMQFHYSSSLVRHQLTHTGEKPYKCPLCDKRFTQKGSMKLHHRTFHLKEPYPKRSRRKNGDSEGETSLADLKVGSW